MDEPSTSQAHVTLDLTNVEDLDEVLVKYRYLSLLEEAQNLGNSNCHESVTGVNSLIDKANELFPNVSNTSHLYWDAQVLHTSAAALEGTVNNVDIGEGSFIALVFAEQLKVKSLDDDGEPSWEVCAGVVQPVPAHNSMPCWSPLLGSFDFQTEMSQTQRKERKRLPKDQIVEKKEPQKLSQVEKVHDGVEEIVQRIFGKLKKHYRNNERKPINFFKFVINPNSFSASVENIFHVSFLINDGHAKLNLIDDEPVISPVLKGKENSNPEETNSRPSINVQNIISIDMQSWQMDWAWRADTASTVVT